jgi:chemotaxis protein MotA
MPEDNDASARGAKQAGKKGSSARPDIATIGGIVLAMVGIVGGLLLEKGSIRDISQITAALIVIAGTMGATLVSTPMSVALGALHRLKSVFFEKSQSPQLLIDEIIRYATKARKNGMVSLEKDALEIEDPFLRKGVSLGVDGTDLQELRKMLELEITLEEHHAEAEAKVFESAGGFAPTIGIIGAVMGLIQVMKNLSNIDEVGHGIAVAFVATVYGVALSNIFLLPMASKIKARCGHETQMKELILEGVIGIVEGLNPKLIRSKLEAYAPPVPAKKGASAKSPARAEAQSASA